MIKSKDNLSDMINEIVKSHEKMLNELQNSTVELNKIFREAFKNLATLSKHLPQNTKVTLNKLTRRGWFVRLREMPISKINWIANLEEDEDSNTQLDNYMMKFIEEHIPLIKSDIEFSYRDRNEIIQEAIKAHNERKYMLSIPTLLSQSDGMFRELFGKYFYKNNAKERLEIGKRIAKILNNSDYPIAATSFTYLYINQLSEESSLHESFEESKIFEEGEDSKKMSRHAVLHGISMNYGSKMNSLKAISLVGSLASIKKILKNRKVL